MAQQHRIIATPELLAQISATASTNNAARVAIYGHENTITRIHFQKADDITWRHMPLPPATTGTEPPHAFVLTELEIWAIISALSNDAERNRDAGKLATAASLNRLAATLLDTIGE